jgi:hypothetical protein
MPTAVPQLAKLRRLIDDEDVKCPAGQSCMAGAGVLCRLEGLPIVANEQPTSLQAFCLNEEGHTQCPTWRAEKERVWAGRRRPISEDAPKREPILFTSVEHMWDEVQANEPASAFAAKHTPEWGR